MLDMVALFFGELFRSSRRCCVWLKIGVGSSRGGANFLAMVLVVIVHTVHLLLRYKNYGGNQMAEQWPV